MKSLNFHHVNVTDGMKNGESVEEQNHSHIHAKLVHSINTSAILIYRLASSGTAWLSG